MTPQRNIKNLLFDLGGVIVDIQRERCVNALTRLGMPDADRMIGLYEQTGPFQLLEQGQITLPEFRDLMRPHFSRAVTDAEIDDAFSAFIVDIPLKRLEALRDLRRRYRTFVLSNTNPLMFHGVIARLFTGEGLTISDYFDGVTVSFEAKATKPNPEIFSYAISTMGIMPEETLFFDDGQTNLDAAGRLGFHTCLVEPGTEFYDLIKPLGL